MQVIASCCPVRVLSGLVLCASIPMSPREIAALPIDSPGGAAGPGSCRIHRAVGATGCDHWPHHGGGFGPARRRGPRFRGWHANQRDHRREWAFYARAPAAWATPGTGGTDRLQDVHAGRNRDRRRYGYPRLQAGDRTHRPGGGSGHGQRGNGQASSGQLDRQDRCHHRRQDVVVYRRIAATEWKDTRSRDHPGHRDGRFGCADTDPRHQQHFTPERSARDHRRDSLRDGHDGINHREPGFLGNPAAEPERDRIH